MLGRKDYTPEELAHGRAAVKAQLAAFEALDSPSTDFEALYFTNMVVVLDRYYVHRIRAVSGKDTNPLNEVELLCASILDHDRVLTTNKVIKWVPEASVLGLADGDPIRPSAEEFAALAKAFFAELETRFAPA